MLMCAHMGIHALQRLTVIGNDANSSTPSMVFHISLFIVHTCSCMYIDCQVFHVSASFICDNCIVSYLEIVTRSRVTSWFS